jgi:heme exporter protein D
MPELGKYAGVIFGSYAVSLVLLAALIGLTFWRGARARDALQAIEARQGKQADG